MTSTRPVEVARAPLDAVVAVPGSKSVANRALVCAALAAGRSVLTGVPDGDDTVVMVDGLRRLGVALEHAGDVVAIDGSGGDVGAAPAALDARLAGTTSRFLTAVAALGTAPITIDGAGPLRKRPMGPLHEALRALGAAVEPAGAPGHLPVTVTGPPHATDAELTLPGDVSSQFLTALMLIGPLLAGGLRITITGELVSRPYVELTARVMARAGVTGVTVDERTVVVPAGRYRGADVAIEADASSASYPLAMAAVAGGRVEVVGLTAGSGQGDARFADLLAAMGCDARRDERSTVVARDRSHPLVGIDVDMASISDLVPTLAAVAVTASTPTTIRGVGFIRGKESDRLGDLAGELGRCGARVSVEPDGLRIEPAPLHGARLDPHDDHRLAMAFGVLGTVVDGIEVADPAVVAKSWPGFWADRAAMLP